MKKSTCTKALTTCAPSTGAFATPTSGYSRTSREPEKRGLTTRLTSGLFTARGAAATVFPFFPFLATIVLLQSQAFEKIQDAGDNISSGSQNIYGPKEHTKGHFRRVDCPKILRGLKSSEFHLGLAPDGEGAVLGHVLHVDAVGLEVAARPHLLVLVAVPLGEAELLADEDLLPARELELAPPQGLDNLGL